MVRFTSLALAVFAFGASVSALAIAGTADFQVVRRDNSDVSATLETTQSETLIRSSFFSLQALDKRAYTNGVAVAPTAIKARSLVDDVEVRHSSELC